MPIQKLTSADVYRSVRTIVGPWCKSNAFKRGSSGLLSYFAPVGQNNLVFWFQVSRDGWDDYAGSKFVVEFQLSEDPRPGTPSGFRQRIPYFLTEFELARIRQIQNSVIASLPKPPQSHFALSISAEVSAWYLERFKPISEPYRSTSDILIYGSAIISSIM
jgi:hypothetical protein